MIKRNIHDCGPFSVPLKTKVSIDLANKLKNYCSKNGLSQDFVVRAAIAIHLAIKNDDKEEDVLYDEVGPGT
jgi:hypothetical protein